MVGTDFFFQREIGRSSRAIVATMVNKSQRRWPTSFSRRHQKFLANNMDHVLIRIVVIIVFTFRITKEYDNQRNECQPLGRKNDTKVSLHTRRGFLLIFNFALCMYCGDFGSISLTLSFLIKSSRL